MARKRYSDEDVLKLLREIELKLNAGGLVKVSSDQELGTGVLHGQAKGFETTLKLLKATLWQMKIQKLQLKL